MIFPLPHYIEFQLPSQFSDRAGRTLNKVVSLIKSRNRLDSKYKNKIIESKLTV